MIIYTGLCGRQQSQTLWEEGGMKVDMLSLALKGRPTCQDQK